MLMLALACSNGGDDLSVPDDTDDPPITLVPMELTSFAVTPSTVVPSVFQVSWAAPGPGTSWVEYTRVGGAGTSASGSSPEIPSAANAHAVRLVGLVAGATYDYRPFTRLDSGTTLEGAAGQIVVPPGPHELVVSASTAAATVPGGYVVTTIIDSDGGWAVILDGSGELVWWYDTGHAPNPPADMAPFVPPSWDGATMPITSRLDEASRSLVVQFHDGNQQLDIATLRRVPLDAMTPDDIVTTRTPLGHHDFVLNSALGVVGFLAYETADVDGTIWASDAIIESSEGVLAADGGGRRLVWSWHSDFDAAEPTLFDGLQEAFLVQGLAELEWTHSNSLMYDEGAASYFVLSKFLDALVKIDRATGEEQWVLGGPYSDFTLPGGEPVWTALDDTALWSHGHMSHLWFDPKTSIGGFVMFDNGYYHPSQDGLGDGWSRVSEFRYDEVLMTVEKVWEYVEPAGGFTPLMGDARKLPSGSYLVGWSSLGRIEEIGPDGVVSWRLDTPAPSITARVSWYDELYPGRP